MLNNNFSKLVKLYKKYKKQQRNKMVLKIFGVVALLGLGYLLFMLAQQRRPAQSVAVATAPAATANTTVAQAHAPAAAPQPEPPKARPPLKREHVETPKVEEMPKKLVKRTPVTHKAKAKREDTFQLKVTQRKSLYKLLVAYKNEKSYDAAIKIAQFYYDEGDYDKAVKWAVEASKKDPAQAQSWIIYAQAKKALGKPEVAKRALSIYLKHNYSQPAQNLLDSL